ncbi:MAG: hypothetical protein ACD_40C00126G0002 [uncultured bacterium]|nr:MAG: hypothetical protein ACD_40C00126G0002 [uncultured bacterium]
MQNSVEKGGKIMGVHGEKGRKKGFPPNDTVIPKVVHGVIHDGHPRIVPQSTVPTTATTLMINSL